MKKKRVLIDMDSVLCDFRKAFVKSAEKKDYTVITENVGFYVRVENDEDHKKWMEMVGEKGFYFEMDPIEGSISAVKEILNNSDFEVFFCTAPFMKYKNCVPEKYQWIEKYFGFEMTKKMVVTRDKTLVKGDYLIDDKPEVIGVVENPEWEHIYFTQPYNKNLEGQRITDWSKWREVLKPGL